MTDAGGPLIVLDDDPTGVQAVAGVPIMLEWDVESLRDVVADDPPAVHLMTNTRAFEPHRAYDIVRRAVRAVLGAMPDAEVVLRGDSTLRGHLFEEYRGVRDELHPGKEAVLLLVPALPAAGRVTRGGVHMLVTDEGAIPLDRTEYARDPSFGYGNAHLLQWAEERSGGHFPADRGRELPVDVLRQEGPGALAEHIIERSSTGLAAVVAPDAEEITDLELVAEGYRRAVAAGAHVIVRCAPTFVGVLADDLAHEDLPMPRSRGSVLVLCGSYVERTTRQLGRLCAEHRKSFVETDIVALASPISQVREVARCAEAAGRLMERDGLAVVTTPRSKPGSEWTLADGERASVGLAQVLARCEPRPDVVVVKGGITSALALRHGLGVTRAFVRGPVADGVALLDVGASQRSPETRFIVFPGNVGGDGLLAEIVAATIPRRRP